MRNFGKEFTSDVDSGLKNTALIQNVLSQILLASGLIKIRSYLKQLICSYKLLLSC